MPPASPLTEALRTVVERRESLTRAAASTLFTHLFEHGIEGDETKMAALLGALGARGETTDELAGFVDARRASATPIPLTQPERERLVDTCGTGGDLSGTFNISTAAALVAAAAGAWVAKHGNRAVTSKCGSADVLEALGIPVDHTPASAAQALREHGFAFLSAPALQPAMRTITPLRYSLGVRTVFNILGPMSNPAGARAQVLGVYSPALVPRVAEALAKLDTRHALIVHGSGIDEFTLTGESYAAEVKDGSVRLFHLVPEDLGLNRCTLADLAGGDTAAENAAILTRIFAGEPGPRRDVVVLNAAAVLLTANLAEDFPAALALANQTIDTGKVKTLVVQLRTQ